MRNIKKVIPLVTLATYLIMIILNALANILPINGIGTGEVSDSYGNLFAPAAITFAIWGVIYLLLLIYTLYQLTYYKTKDEEKKKLFISIGIIFSISSVINSVWILAWHYENIFLSLILMIGILLSLIAINLLLKSKEMTIRDKLLIKLPFTVYFGWITVASIANIVTYLVAIEWNQFGLTESFWATIIVIVGAIISSICIIFYKSKAYGLVILWAYSGILLKHLSVDGFDGEYLSVIVAVILSILILVLAEVLLIKQEVKVKHES